MKYSALIGILFCLFLVLTAFFPWIHIESLNVYVSGVGADIKTVFGKPALMNFYLLPIIILFFLIPRLWAKKLNPFVGAINFAWALRNFLLLSTCRNGECPQQQAALYIYFLSAVVILVMTVLPYKANQQPTTNNLQLKTSYYFFAQPSFNVTVLLKMSLLIELSLSIQ